MGIIKMALHDCTPAHALMELVRGGKVAHNEAWTAYQARFGVECGMGLAQMERVEAAWIKRHGI